MKHYIAYHNPERMGRALHETRPLEVLTNKSVKHLLGNTVWFVTREGGGGEPRYALGSFFQVSEVGDATEADFEHFAKGPGHVFKPPIPLNDRDWFPELMRSMGNFGLGVQEIGDPAVVLALKELARESGWQVS